MYAVSVRAMSRQPFLRDTATTRSLHFSEREIQSRMSRLSPDALDLEYTRMMMGFLLFNAHPRQIGMIGLGGGSLPKFCFRYVLSAHIDVVEIDPEVIAMRDAFMIPPDNDRFHVIEGDGAAFVQAAGNAYDVLLLDGFGEGGIPDALCSAAFYADCYDALTEDGLMVVNFHANHPMHHDYLARVRESFGSAMFEVVDDDMTNSILFACKGDLLDGAEALVLTRPAAIAKDAWRQLMPTFRVIAATKVLR